MDQPEALGTKLQHGHEAPLVQPVITAETGSLYAPPAPTEASFFLHQRDKDGWGSSKKQKPAHQPQLYIHEPGRTPPNRSTGEDEQFTTEAQSTRRKNNSASFLSVLCACGETDNLI